MKRIAVITDAMSDGYFFPKWHSYYGGLFGSENLFVLTYKGTENGFRSVALGSIRRLEERYNDELRARVISDWVTALLEVYDVVIRCDVDEFLIPNPSRYEDLRAFAEEMGSSHVTARGIDVIERLSDPPLDMSQPILGTQRTTGVRAAALNKTAMVSAPTRWAPGFHACTRVPRFGDVYLLHMKFADVRRRIEWFKKMEADADPGSSEHLYFSNAMNKLIGHQHWCLNKPRQEVGLNDTAFDKEFLGSVAFNEINGIYQGEFIIGPNRFDIPKEYSGIV